MNLQESLIQRHEDLWTNGKFKRSKHKFAEIYELVGNGKEWIMKDDKGYRVISKPRNSGNRITWSGHSPYFPTLESLRQHKIDDFPAHRAFYTNRVRFVEVDMSGLKGLLKPVK